MSEPQAPQICSVTTFYSPSLLWITFDHEIDQRNLLRDKLNKISEPYPPLTEVIEGQKVIVNYDEEWVRAEIAVIKESDVEYVCFLIDYGIFAKTSSVFELPEHANLIHGFAYKATLYGLRSISSLYDFGNMKLEERNEVSWAPGIRKNVNEILQRCNVTQYFKKKFQLDEYLVGNLLISDPNLGIYDINNCIIGLGLAKLNEIEFTSGICLNKKPELPLKQIYEETRNNRKKTSDEHSKEQKLNHGRGSFRTPSQLHKTSCGSQEVEDYSNFEDADSKLESTVVEACNSFENQASLTSFGRGLSKSLKNLEVNETKPKKTIGRGCLIDKINGKTNESLDNSETSFDSTKNIVCGRGLALLKKMSPPKQDDQKSNDSKDSDKAQEEEFFDTLENKTIGRGYKIKKTFDSLNKQSTCTTTESINDDDVDEQFEDALETLNNLEENENIPPVEINTIELPTKTMENQPKTTYNIRKSDYSECKREMIQTGRCECKSCESVRDNSMVFEKYEQKIIQPKPKTVCKPNLLFKLPNEEEIEYEIKTKRVFRKDTDKLSAPRLLVHGYFIPEPVSDLCYVPFNEGVQRSLKEMRYETGLSIQSYAWPAIMRGHHVFIVSPPESGKTMSYVPAICTFSLNSIPELPEAVGPVTIILCPKVKVAETVFRYVDLVLGPQKQRKVFLAVPPYWKQLKTDISSVEILVCTPRILMKMLKEDIFSLRKLCFVVLECSNILFELFPKEMEILLNFFQKVLIKRTFQMSIQLISVSQEWSKPIENVAKKLKAVPLICIGSHLEAALYGRADIQIQFVEPSIKASIIIDLLKTNSKILKTVIICNDSNEKSQLLTYLNTHGIDYDSLDESSTRNDINSVKQRWENNVSGNYFILVCTDEIFNTELVIMDAFIVVQYSLPETWSQFSYRFLAFFDNYQSPLIKKQTEKQRCKMHIFVNNSNMKQFPRMVQFLERMGCNLSKNILNQYNELVQEIEFEKLSNKVRLCDKMLINGACKDVISCRNRHALSNLDVSNTLPQSGLIKIKILHAANPVCYYVRLIEHTDAEGQIHAISDYFGQIALKMSELINEENRKPVINIRLGNIFALEESKELFRRCEVIRILEMNVLKRPKKVVVRLIDIGSTMTAFVSNLYVLPEQLRKIPAQAVPIYLTNIGPPERDDCWSQHSTNLLIEELKNNSFDEANSFFTGRIKLQLKDALLVDDLKLEESIDNGDLIVHKTSVRNFLLKSKLAENRPIHLMTLYKSCQIYNIQLPDYNLPITDDNSTKNESQVEPNWAHLENFREFNAVFFSVAYSPDLFFIKLCKNKEAFDQLNSDIKEAMSKPLYPEVLTVKEGNCYLVQDPVEKNYVRVLVTKITDNTAYCLSVDFGDELVVSTFELKFLPNHLITQLPFQAIECKLFGIKPVGSDWLDESTNIFYDIANEPGTDLLRFLYVKVVSEEIAEITNYKKYSIILVDIFEENTIINNLFLDSGQAVQTTNERIEIDFDLFKHKNDDSEIESTEDSDESSSSNDDEYESEIIDDMDLEQELNDLGLQINYPEKFLRALLGLPEPDVKIIEKESKAQENSYEMSNQSKTFEKVGYSTPKVLWQQKESSVILHVEIPGVDKYEVKVLRKRFLMFKTTYNKTLYKLELNLYSKIQKKIEHKKLGLYVLIKLKKDLKEEWPRLTMETKRLRNITFNCEGITGNFDDITKITDEMFEKSKEYGKIFGGEDGPYLYNYGSDIEWDKSDVESNQDSDDS